MTENIKTYLDNHFLTLSQLARRARMPEEKISALIKAKCIPGPSYELRKSGMLYTYLFGKVGVAIKSSKRYYAPSVTAWIQRAQALAPGRDFRQIAKTMRTNFEKEFRQAMVDLDGRRFGFQRCFIKEGIFEEKQTTKMLKNKWRHFLEGTYGLCVKEPTTARSITRKLIAVSRLAQLTNDGKKKSFLPEERGQVISAMREFDAVVAKFDPVNYPISSRKRLLDDLRKKYKIWKRL